MIVLAKYEYTTDEAKRGMQADWHLAVKIKQGQMTNTLLCRSWLREGDEERRISNDEGVLYFDIQHSLIGVRNSI